MNSKNYSLIWLSVFVASTCIFKLHRVNALNCGEVNLTRPLIIGGTETLRGEWPFVVALYLVDFSKYICGGTLISHKHILTAAHCVQNKYSSNIRPLDSLVVHLGAYNLSSNNEEGAVQKNVSQIHIHPDWDVYSEKYDADIAILTLSDNVTFSNFIQPVCIPADDAVNDGMILNFKGFIVGWAPTNRTQVETPRQAITKVLNASYCFDKDPNLAHHSSQRTFCGWDEDGSVDIGDSGGGFLVLSGSAWVQFGIISAARANSTGHVLPQSPAIYTNIREFTSWIVETTGGAVGEANGMKIIVNCEYLFFETNSGIYYLCAAYGLDIQNKNFEVGAFTGAHQPQKSDRDVDAISFYNGTMAYLPDKIGLHFKNLKFLYTAHVETLKSVSRTNFHHLENLLQLVFQDNKVEVIDEDALWDLPELEILNMEDNLIHTLHEKTFEKNVKLKRVNFFNNSIQFLPKDLFKKNLLLEFIDFGFNFLKIIEIPFLGIKNIVEINFNGNICTDSVFRRTDEGISLTEFHRSITANCSSNVTLI